DCEPYRHWRAVLHRRRILVLSRKLQIFFRHLPIRRPENKKGRKPPLIIEDARQSNRHISKWNRFRYLSFYGMFGELKILIPHVPPKFEKIFPPPRFSSGFRLRNRCSETVAPTPVLGISPPAHTATAPGLCLQAKQGGRPISSPDLTPDSLLPRRASSFSSRRRAFPSHNGRQDNRADI